MPDKNLYNIRIPSDSQVDAGLDGLGQEIESLSGLDADVPVVELLGVQSGDQSIQASYANQRAQVTAAELEELMSANGFDKLPYYTPSEPGRQGDGYIAIGDGSVETASVHEDRVQVVSGTFTRSGGRASDRRRLRCRPQEVHRNDYGNVKEALVAIPGSARKRTWYQRATQAREPVMVAESVDVEGGQVDLVDAYTVGLSAPFDLVYDQEYAAGHRVDIVLWDTRGYEDRNGLSDGDLAWQRCYKTSHEYSGAPVVDTGRLRLWLDDVDGLTAESWDAASSAWTQLSLPSSDWQLRDRTITTISPVKIQAQVEFENTATGELFALDMVARRGREVVHWLVPSSVDDVTPTGLQSLLDPIADPAVVRGQESLGLIDRGEIRR